MIKKKNLQKAGIEETYFIKIKTVYSKPTANIILNGEKLKVSTKIRSKTRISTLTILVNIVLEV